MWITVSPTMFGLCITKLEMVNKVVKTIIVIMIIRDNP